MDLFNTRFIRFCASFIAAAFILSGTLYSQIIYTDIEPDITQTEPGVYILNFFIPPDEVEIGDDTNIEIIRTATGVFVTTRDSSQVITDSWSSPLASQKDVTLKGITNNGFWKSVTDATLNSPAGGRWINLTDRYLGVRVMKNGAWHYGWARMDVDAAPTHFRIKDYAFNSVPDDSIQTGQTITSVNDDFNGGFSISYYNRILTVNTNAAALSVGSIEIYSIFGERVTESRISSSTQTINMDVLQPGVYFVQVRVGSSSRSAKIMVY